jgi:hypothetical protein
VTLPRIQSKNKYVIQPVEKKEFQDLYISNLGIFVDEKGNQPAVTIFRAYNYDTKEISPDPEQAEKFVIENIWDQVVRSPVFKSSFESMVNTINLLYKEEIVKRELTKTPEGAERDSKVKELEYIQTSLGIDPLEEPPAYQEIIWAK